MKLLPFTVALALMSCASEPISDAGGVSAVEAELIYTNRLASVSLPVACGEFGGVLGFVSDTAVVRDPAAIAQLRLAASEAERVPASTHEMDARLVALLHGPGGTDTLCVGGSHSAEVNGVPVRDSALVRLLWAAARP